jgi:GT2 family glycosyltransferase
MIALTATVQRECPMVFLDNLINGVGFYCYHNEPNIGVVPAYHKCWGKHGDEDIQVYMHDDVSIHEPWEQAIRTAFEDPKVAIVGLGGATGIGLPEIYKCPYKIEQLQRIDYGSNQTDWLVHGTRVLHARQVAVVDGFFMAIRGTFLEQTNGWDWIRSNFHCYDLAMCLEAYRRGWKVVTVGISCTHHGGGTSTGQEYAEWCLQHGTTMEDEHKTPHVWLYDRYRDILPLRIDNAC